MLVVGEGERGNGSSLKAASLLGHESGMAVAVAMKAVFACLCVCV
jgi:hypothetical protein